jgi:copper homeostasis protein
MAIPLPVEIAVQDAAGVRIALEAGAARVELCQALGVGGLTPSAGLIATAVERAAAASAPSFVHVLVRPRGGGFVYDDDELDLILRDIRVARSLGAAGVVVGALTDADALDLGAIAAFVDAADGLDVTVHRAVDAASHPVAAVAALAGTGVRRVLTSGGAIDCRTGRDALARMASEAGGAIEIMAGGGVDVGDIPMLAGAGVDAVHLSARIRATRGGPGGPGGGEAGFDTTDAAIVRAAVAAAGGRMPSTGSAVR